MSQNSYEQAQAQLDSIRVMVAALEVDYDRLAELQEQREDLTADELEELAELEGNANGCSDYDEALTQIQDDPLCIEVRSGWCTPSDGLEAEEFRILLCTGGPAVQIVGELDNGEPTRAWIEHQDWYEPWVEFHGDRDTDALLTYCRQFLFA